MPKKRVKRKTKAIEIQGSVEVPLELDFDDFWNIFIDFIEDHKWSFGGGMNEIIDGRYVMPDGSLGEPM